MDVFFLEQFSAFSDLFITMIVPRIEGKGSSGHQVVREWQ